MQHGRLDLNKKWKLWFLKYLIITLPFEDLLDKPRKIEN